MLASPLVVGVSLKMYFSLDEAGDWLQKVADMTRYHPAIRDGSVELIVLPSFVAIPSAELLLAGTGVQLGAQDVSAEDAGPFTGEVSPVELAQAGVRFVVVGHAERRRLFGEDESVVAAKTAAVLRNGLIPILCLGEETHMAAPDAAADVVRQLRAAVGAASPGRLIVAYEPNWAIGASEPAPATHVSQVTSALRSELANRKEWDGCSVIYGGSAGPGTLTELSSSIDGVFLGRFVHDPSALLDVLTEAGELADERQASARRPS